MFFLQYLRPLHEVVFFAVRVQAMLYGTFQKGDEQIFAISIVYINRQRHRRL